MEVSRRTFIGMTASTYLAAALPFPSVNLGPIANGLRMRDAYVAAANMEVAHLLKLQTQSAHIAQGIRSRLMELTSSLHNDHRAHCFVSALQRKKVQLPLLKSARDSLEFYRELCDRAQEITWNPETDETMSDPVETPEPPIVDTAAVDVPPAEKR